MTTVSLARHFAVAGVLLAFLGGTASAGLIDYVQKADNSFSWKLKEKKETPEGTVYDLQLVSQTWQNMVWEHQLQVYLPKDVKPTATMFLWNQGGTANASRVAFGMELATKMKAPVAFLYGIPNQPLFDGLKEDALIAETFVRYLKTKDDSWPLLFPMVKSLVRAMDALQAFAKQEWKNEVSHFIVAGASKRGWTTWMTAASDPRVKAFLPLVIDTLKMTDQMEYQLKSYGKYSDMIADYTRAKLVPIPDTPEAKKLWSMVDPWLYRERTTQPKLIINGTNDPYWTQDALNLYWDDIKGDKWVLYVPNAGHNLQQKHDLPNPIPDLTRAINSQAAFARHMIHGTPMPKLQWQHAGPEAKMTLVVESDILPKAMRIWTARATTRDFRQAKWTSTPFDPAKRLVIDMAAPDQGCFVFFAEVEYEMDGLKYYLSTQLRVAGKAKE